MKITELRIGNLVSAANVITPVLSVHGANVVSVGEGLLENYDISEVLPIPLTPEILLKAGFENLEYQAFTFIDKYVGEDGFILRLKLENGKSGFFLVGNGGFDESGEMDITKTCQYVHQLQNIYFAISGEELTINL